jgi:hypothetical protein
MLTKKEFQEITAFQKNQMIELASTLNKLAKRDIETALVFLSDPEQLNLLRSAIVQTRNDAAIYRAKFVKLDHQVLIGLYGKEMGVLGDLLVAFGKRTFTEDDLKIVKNLNGLLLKFTIKILDALVSFEAKTK